jgi:fermentation-respiration switch protein FrsA (DUF1100 family)
MAFVSRASRLSFRKTSWLQRIRLPAIILAGLFAVICLLAFLFQDRMIYFPSVERVPPPVDWLEVVEIDTTDGETLIAWHVEAMPGCPTFLFFDGNAGRPEIQMGRWVRMRDRGAGLLAVYYRGYSGSTGRPSETGLYRDAEAGYDWLTAQGVSSHDIVIHGFSLGSGPATWLAARREAGALILEAPYYSMLDLVRRKMRLLPVSLILRHRFRSDRAIENVEEPVLMAHGTSDSVIPISQSQRLAALTGSTVRYETFPGSEHATLVRDGLYEHVWPFLETEGRLDPQACISPSLSAPN